MATRLGKICIFLSDSAAVEKPGETAAPRAQEYLNVPQRYTRPGAAGSGFYLPNYFRTMEKGKWSEPCYSHNTCILGEHGYCCSRAKSGKLQIQRLTLGAQERSATVIRDTNLPQNHKCNFSVCTFDDSLFVVAIDSDDNFKLVYAATVFIEEGEFNSDSVLVIPHTIATSCNLASWVYLCACSKTEVMLSCSGSNKWYILNMSATTLKITEGSPALPPEHGFNSVPAMIDDKRLVAVGGWPLSSHIVLIQPHSSQPFQTLGRIPWDGVTCCGYTVIKARFLIGFGGNIKGPSDKMFVFDIQTRTCSEIKKMGNWHQACQSAAVLAKNSTIQILGGSNSYGSHFITFSKLVSLIEDERIADAFYQVCVLKQGATAKRDTAQKPTQDKPAQKPAPKPAPKSADAADAWIPVKHGKPGSGQTKTQPAPTQNGPVVPAPPKQENPLQREKAQPAQEPKDSKKATQSTIVHKSRPVTAAGSAASASKLANASGASSAARKPAPPGESSTSQVIDIAQLVSPPASRLATPGQAGASLGAVGNPSPYANAYVVQPPMQFHAVGLPALAVLPPMEYSQYQMLPQGAGASSANAAPLMYSFAPPPSYIPASSDRSAHYAQLAQLAMSMESEDSEDSAGPPKLSKATSPNEFSDSMSDDPDFATPDRDLLEQLKIKTQNYEALEKECEEAKKKVEELKCQLSQLPQLGLKIQQEEEKTRFYEAQVRVLEEREMGIIHLPYPELPLPALPVHRVRWRASKDLTRRLGRRSRDHIDKVVQGLSNPGAYEQRFGLLRDAGRQEQIIRALLTQRSFYLELAYQSAVLAPAYAIVAVERSSVASRVSKKRLTSRLLPQDMAVVGGCQEALSLALPGRKLLDDPDLAACVKHADRKSLRARQVEQELKDNAPPFVQPLQEFWVASDPLQLEALARNSQRLREQRRAWTILMNLSSGTVDVSSAIDGLIAAYRILQPREH